LFFAGMTKYRIAILASGNGTNAEKIITHFTGNPNIAVALVLSNNPDAFVLQRAAKLGVRAVVFSKQQFRESNEVVDMLKKERITHVVLAGFLWLVPPNLLGSFPNRIVNIHPALLPKHGGKGMYGLKVHEAVRTGGDTETGITVHLVNANYDDGKILFQATCPVMPTDGAEEIAEKVSALEYKFYPEVIERWVNDQASTA